MRPAGLKSRGRHDTRGGARRARAHRFAHRRARPTHSRPLPAHPQPQGMARTNAEFRGIGPHRR
ncbi:hypothetical protein A8H37_02845 [Burkholderia thailandensis]|nr:hypothetical protein A8H37_02845 [Burkholderia thailandensis]